MSVISWSAPKKKKKHKKAANTNEIIWLALIAEAHKPTAAKVAISKNNAMYEPTVPATSKFHTGFPNTHTTYTYSTDGSKMISNKKSIPKYLPNTIFKVLTGLVNKRANIPLFFSSEILLIVSAGTKNTNIHDESLKKGNISAKPAFRML